LIIFDFERSIGVSSDGSFWNTCAAVAVCTSSPRTKISLSTGSSAMNASTRSSTCE
jgi:hypothetical protein